MDLKNLVPISQPSLEERTTESIRELILNREIPFGTHLTETTLAESLQVSRAVIRTAFQQLRHEGLLEHRQNKGMFVVELTANDVWEIFTLRDKMEALATELVTSNMNGAKRKVLEEVLENMKLAAINNDYEESHRQDWIFHQKLIELTGHNRLIESYRLLSVQTRLFLSLTKEFHLDSNDILNLHEPIIKAMLNGNVENAMELMSNHIIDDGKQLLRRLQKKNSEGGNEK